MHEEIELFSGPVEMLGCRHLPSAAPVGAVLVCSAGPFDAAVDRGRTARLARRLAAGGVAVQRLHPVDEPPLDEPVPITFASLVEGARDALDRLRAACTSVPVAFVGARLGALVAARLARGHGTAPVAVWEPALDPLLVLEVAAATAGRWAQPDGAVAGGSVAAESVDLFGTPLAAELVDGTVVGGLLDELGPAPRSLLLAQTSDGDEISPDHAAFVARARHARLTVDTTCHTCDGWCGRELVPVADPGPIVEDTAAWLVTQLAAPGATPAATGAAGPRPSGTVAL